jgi:hypothetical protein
MGPDFLAYARLKCIYTTKIQSKAKARLRLIV